MCCQYLNETLLYACSSWNTFLYLVTWAANDGGKHGARCVIAGKPSLDQTRAVVTHQGGDLVVVTHAVSSASEKQPLKREF